MIKIQSRDLYAVLERRHPDFPEGLDKNLAHFAYNALDSGVTLRIHQRLVPLVAASPHATTSYRFVRAMQGPALDMMRRGVMIQQKVRQDETERYLNLRGRAQALLDELADAVWGPDLYDDIVYTTETYIPTGKRGQPLAPRTRRIKTVEARTRPRGLNAGSSKQVLAFFNGALGLPIEYETRKTPHGTERTPSANDKALKKWGNVRTKGPGINPRDRGVHPVRLAAPFVSLILTVRSADKMLAVLRSPLDPDGRMRCSYNVVGTENGRWSSSQNVFGRGTNLQNITSSMRRMFCADDGWRLISTDLEQAESYLVAALVWQCTGDRTYWDAILSGDLHTQVCRMAWPELPWTGDLKLDRKIAETNHPGLKYSYRDVAKRLGHGSSYDGSAWGISAAVGIPLAVVELFQQRFFAPTAFFAIKLWHKHIRANLSENRYLDTPLQRRRWFFSRPEESSTQREAIAYTPQSTVGELLNLIMYKCWARSKLTPFDPQFLPIQLLLQNHDAFMFQSPNHIDLPKLIAAVNSEFTSAIIPILRGEESAQLVIPGEFVSGWNWAYRDNDPNQANWTFKEGNPDGLTKWRGADARTRTQPARSAPSDWLGGVVSRAY